MESPNQSPNKSISWLLPLAAMSIALGGGAVVRTVRENSLRILARNNPDNLQASLKEPEISEVKYFQDIVGLLKSQYVEQIVDEQKLASGAVRSMVLSLGDPHSVYRSKEQNAIYKSVQKGSFEGIGIQLMLHAPKGARVSMTRSTEEGDAGVDDAKSAAELAVPTLIVKNIATGSPAAGAGLNVGDKIISVDGRWIVDQSKINEFQAIVRDYARSKDVAARKLLNEKIRAMSKDLRGKLAKGIMPAKAWDLVTSGTEGSVDLEWEHNGALVRKTISRATTVMQPSSNVLRLGFTAGDAEKLKAEVGKGQPITIDLSAAQGGSKEEFLKCLAAVAPNGEYGFIINRRGKPPTRVSVSSGTTKPISYNLIVLPTTSGYAEAFARILEAKKLATLSQPTTAGDLVFSEDKDLPDGSGYTLSIGTFSFKAPEKRTSSRVRKEPTVPSLTETRLPEEAIA